MSPPPAFAATDAAAPLDVLVVGGGLVGASLAIGLGLAGRRVALLEATPTGRAPAVFDQRNLSCAETTLNALGALGVLAHLRAPRGPIARIHVSRLGGFGRAIYDAADHGRRAFGEVIVASDLGAALEARLAELPAVRRWRPARFLGLGASQDGVREVQVEADGETRSVRTRLLVGADGSDSQVRTALGIAATRHDYAQTLFVARVRTNRPPAGLAYERFGPDGPNALLPRGDGHYGAIHGVAREEADAVAALDDSAWLARLQRVFGWRAGRFLAAGPRSAYPIVGVQAARLVAPRAVLVGNAAQSLHPIGAQGFNLGLRDAMTLLDVLADADDPGADHVLAAHAARRVVDRAETLRFSDGLARITARRAPWIEPLASAALLGALQWPAIEARLLAGAMGWRGEVPSTCRGTG
jgi:2-octaprenyl-6-methoxyphenol hydroxylase